MKSVAVVFIALLVSGCVSGVGVKHKIDEDGVWNSHAPFVKFKHEDIKLKLLYQHNESDKPDVIETEWEYKF